MKRRTVLLWVTALVVLVAVATGAIAAAGERSPDAANQIAGTWRVSVNRPAPLPPLTSLQVYTSDGSMIENANEPPTTRTESYGVWEQIGDRLYAASSEFPRFNPQTGAQVGTTKVNRTIRLSPDGQTFTAVARATLLDLNGNVVSSFLVTATGVRMHVERIPEVP
jgi:hypothetical protein